MELRPRNEEDLRAAVIGLWGPKWTFLLLAVLISVGISLLILIFTAGPHPRPALMVTTVSIGTVLGVGLWRLLITASCRNAYADCFIRADEEGLHVRGRAGTRRLEIRSRWANIAAIQMGRPTKLSLVSPLVRAIESHTMIIREKSGESVAFGMVGIIFAPDELAKFLEFAGWHIGALPPPLPTAGAVPTMVQEGQ